MFKLSVEFKDIAALTAFVTKMGSEVQGGTITHAQPIESSEAPKTKSKKTKAETQAAAVEVAAPTSPFPGGFNPGGSAQPAPQLANPAPTVGLASAPSVAPVAEAQVAAAPTIAAAPVAPIAQATAVISEERKKFNEACAQLISYLEQGGTAKGYTPEQLGGVISGSMLEAGIAQGTKISAMSDAQVQAFYPVLYKNVLAAVPQV